MAGQVGQAPAAPPGQRPGLSDPPDHDRFQPDRRTAAARAIGSRMGRPRRRAIHPRQRPPASLRSRADSERHGEAWSARHLGAAGIRRRRHGLHLSRPCQRRTGVPGHVAARDHVGARRSQLPVAADVGDRGSEAALPGAAGGQGRKLAGYGLTEPGAGSDARAIQTTAIQERRPLRPERREELDLARRRRRQLPGDRVDRPREEETAAIRPA